MDWILLLLALTYTGVSVSIWLYAPVNVAAFLCVMQGGFYLIPSALYFLLMPSYRLEAFSIIQSAYLAPVDISMMVVPSLLSVVMLAGAAFGWFAGNKGASKNVRKMYSGVGTSNYSGHSRKLTVTVAIAFIAPVVLMSCYLLTREGNSIELLLLPSRKDKNDIYGSYYALQLFTNWPLVVALTSLAYYRRRALVFAILMFGLACVFAFGTGQRVRLVSIVLAGVFWLLWSRWPESGSIRSRWRGTNIPETWIIRTKIISLTLGVSLLVPLLWWARNVANQLRDKGSIDESPIEVAGVLDTFFGSPATGLPAFNVISKYIELNGFQYGYILRDLLVLPIPRSVWPSKPQVMDAKLVDALDLNTVPSVFIINELWLAFGVLSLFVTLLLFGGLAFLCNRIARTCRISLKVAAALFAGFSLVLFKDGIVIFFSYYGLSLGMLFTALVIVWCDKNWDDRLRRKGRL